MQGGNAWTLRRNGSDSRACFYCGLLGPSISTCATRHSRPSIQLGNCKSDIPMHPQKMGRVMHLFHALKLIHTFVFIFFAYFIFFFFEVSPC